jgi:predicted Zn-dependent protease
MRLAIFALACLPLAAQDGESALAEQLARQANRLSEPVANADVQGYIARLGAKLAGSSARTFTVIEDARMPPYEPVMFPHACLVSADLIRASKSESELAGMLAQALARDFRWIRSDRSGPFSMMYFPGGDPPGLLAPVDVRDKIRAIELQADRDAVPRMAAAGFDPKALATYLDRVQLAGRERSALPPRDERVAAIEEAIRRLPPATYSAPSPEFERVQSLLRPR